MDEEPLPPGGWDASDPLWEPWSPAQAAERLAAVPVRWCVAAGWALELFCGTATRAHEDLEIAIPAAGFPAIRAALADLEFQVVGSGRAWPLDSPAFDVMHQTWGQDPATGSYRLDVFREPHQGDTWICRRDRSIQRPYSTLIMRSAEDIPYLAPEVVLLFKARHLRPKDQGDFAMAAPLLTAPQRTWLTSALRQVHPGHPWLAML